MRCSQQQLSCPQVTSISELNIGAFGKKRDMCDLSLVKTSYTEQVRIHTHSVYSVVKLENEQIETQSVLLYQLALCIWKKSA